MSLANRKKRKKYPNQKYNWDKWFSKNRFVLKRGTHFECMPHSMSVQVRRVAERRGLRVSVFIDESDIHVEVQ